MTTDSMPHAPRPTEGSVVPLLLPRLAAIGALAFAFFPAGPVQAASIAWGTPTLISANTDVSTTGSLLYAYTFGDASVNPTLVNGVSFETFPVPHLGNATVTVGSVSLDVGGLQSFHSTETGAGSSSAPFTDLSNAYQRLLESGVSSSFYLGNLTLTLGGLTPGQSYQVQFWSHNAGSLTFRTAGTTYTAGNSVTLDDNNTGADGGVGQWVIGLFMADASSQVVSLASSDSNDQPVLTALIVQAVPEPSASLLLLSGGAALCLRHRRVRRA